MWVCEKYAHSSKAIFIYLRAACTLSLAVLAFCLRQWQWLKSRCHLTGDGDSGYHCLSGIKLEREEERREEERRGGGGGKGEREGGTGRTRWWNVRDTINTYMYMIIINEPQLPRLRTAIYHTGLDVKKKSHPVCRTCTCTRHITIYTMWFTQCSFTISGSKQQ